jgi:hypothetical protein
MGTGLGKKLKSEFKNENISYYTSYDEFLKS